MMAIIGSEMSGKTDLIKLLAGYFREDEGECQGQIRVGGVEGLSMKEIRHVCGYVLKEDWVS
jgi:ABC-type phosphate/phosphonate transport system ATPase subunit